MPECPNGRTPQEEDEVVSKQMIDIECTLERETQKAVLVTTDVSSEVWIPKSMCEIEKKDPNDEMPCAGTITLSERYAVDKEIV